MTLHSPTSAGPPAFISTGEFCRITGISPTTVKRMCDRGEVAHIVISDRGDRRIPYREVERLLAEAEATRVGPTP
jgi:excisionase family DNA binding protein